MDKTICSSHLTVPSDDDVPFADERHRYLRHCEEVCVTAPSLKGAERVVALALVDIIGMNQPYRQHSLPSLMAFLKEL